LSFHGFPGPMCSYAVASQEIPAPFAKAKHYAMTRAQPDYLGRYLLTFEGRSDSKYVFYILGYLSRQMIIGVGKAENGKLVVAEYHESGSKFMIYVGGDRREAAPEKVIEFAFSIFRELVANKLI